LEIPPAAGTRFLSTAFWQASNLHRFQHDIPCARAVQEAGHQRIDRDFLKKKKRARFRQKDAPGPFHLVLGHPGATRWTAAESASERLGLPQRGCALDYGIMLLRSRFVGQRREACVHGENEGDVSESQPEAVAPECGMCQ
jgi:hypothetical protein